MYKRQALHGGTGAAFAKVVQQADEQHPLAVGGNSGVNFQGVLAGQRIGGQALGALREYEQKTKKKLKSLYRL